jgi:hypothetical protein
VSGGHVICRVVLYSRKYSMSASYKEDKFMLKTFLRHVTTFYGKMMVKTILCLTLV